MIDQLFCRFIEVSGVNLKKKMGEFNKMGLYLKRSVNRYNIYSKIKDI